MLIICGHQRSGTTLMRQLCNGHPQISMLSELGCCRYLGLPRLQFLWRLLGLLKIRGNLPPMHRQPRDRSWSAMVSKWLFLARFSQTVWQRSAGSNVGGPQLENALRQLFPKSAVVGDKYPDYVFELERLLRWENVRCLVMVRDPRDVAASTLERVKHRWRGAWTEAIDSAPKIALRWSHALTLVPREDPRVMLVRYEDLVSQPETVTQRLAHWLGVDSSGFPLELVHVDSLGNYRKSLSPSQCGEIEALAAAGMRQHGYL